MAELAVVSVRKAKMQKYIEEGNKNAEIVMELLEDPNEFLSTVQIGISLIGVLTGAFGGVTLAEPLAKLISFIPYSEPISVAIVVIITTYLTLVVGEIVPKVIALNDPERISLKVAKSMVILEKVSKPVSFILAKSSSFLLWAMRIENKNDDVVTEEEIELMIKEGREDGTIEQEEEAIIKRVFKLDDQKVESIMTPRNEIIWIDLLLKEFKENQGYVHMCLVVDEFGSVEGLITLNDLLEGIVGDIPGIDEEDEPQATQRDDGTWLIDGRYPIDRFKELFDFNESLPDEEEDGYTTLAGFILSLSGTIPNEKDKYECGRFIFEIIDLDGHQIDKVLVTDLGPQEPINTEE